MRRGFERSFCWWLGFKWEGTEGENILGGESPPGDAKSAVAGEKVPGMELGGLRQVRSAEDFTYKGER